VLRIYGPDYELQQRKLKPLKRSVLEHLKDHGPHTYNVLYVLFDEDRSAMIEPVLQDLLKWNYIHWQTENSSMIEITARGLALLADRDYWTG